MGTFEKCIFLGCILALAGITLFSHPDHHESKVIQEPWGIPCDDRHPCQSGCCSHSGICGVGPEYCGADTCIDCRTRARPRSKTSHLRRFVGYYELWSADRPCNRMAAFELPSATYAHVNLAFITIDPTTFEVVPIPAAHANAIQRFTQRKKYDPDLRVFVTVSGLAPHDWSKPDASVFSRLARSDAHQTVFLRSLTSFISTYDIDGVDINWEHPDGFSDDYENLPKLMQNIRSALLLTGGRYGLSMTLPVSLPNLHHYNLRRLPRYVDYFNLMPLDLHSQLQMGDTWQGQSLGPVVNMTQVEEAMDLLWRNHVMPDNVNFGIALYSASLVPADRECTHVGCPALSGATPGFSSLKQGMLMNSEVQDLMDPAFHERAHGRLYHRHDWGSRALQYSVLDADAGVRISQNKHQWIAYEDRETLEKKLESARDLGFGGVVVWAMSHDTYNADYTKVLDCLLEEKFHRRKSLQYHYCNEIQLHQV